MSQLKVLIYKQLRGILHVGWHVILQRVCFPKTQ